MAQDFFSEKVTDVKCSVCMCVCFQSTARMRRQTDIFHAVHLFFLYNMDCAMFLLLWLKFVVIFMR